MGRGANHEHVRRTLQALSILRSEPGWHRVSELAKMVDAKPERLAADLRRACYAASDWSLPLMFGDDMEPPNPLGSAVVQMAAEVATTLPLPASRVELTRWALLADAAARLDPDDARTPVLRAFHERVAGQLGIAPSLDVQLSAPAALEQLRLAIAQSRMVRFAYRALDASDVRERIVSPERVWRDGRWWLLLGHDHARAATRTFRVDRIVGDVVDAGPAVVREDADAGTDGDGGTGSVPRTRVRLRIGADEQWAVDAFEPTGLLEDGDRVEVTIELYAPVGARLSRLLFLLRPGASVEWTDSPVGKDGVLGVHRRALAALRDTYRDAASSA